MAIKEIMLVGVGGFVGSALRYLLGGVVQRAVPLAVFPYGTLAVNVLGCLLIGFLGGLVEFRQLLDPGQRLFLLVGVLGGFTTFSTFAFETLTLAQDAELFKASINILAQVILGMLAALTGFVAARLI